MAEKPILFSGPMVTAILEGRKTMTRRVMRPQPNVVHGKTKTHLITNNIFRDGRQGIVIPYPVGATLWVRETWAYATGPNRDEPDTPEHYGFIYREEWDRLQPGYPLNGAWKPSIFMPKKAARIWLEVTDVRAERLQDITEEDAMAEGMPTLGEILCLGGNHKHPMRRESFEVLWDMINEKRGFPWASNPWVWAYTFRRIEP